MKTLASSILSADFSNLRDNIELTQGAGANWLHFDVMDGQFVPQISFGIPVCRCVRKTTDMTLDVHLMIVEPNRYAEAFHKAGADIITIHAESFNAPVMTDKGTRVISTEVDVRKVRQTLQQIRSYGIKAGLSINPNTPVDIYEDFLGEFDLALIMSVFPGFGGQKYIEESTNRIARLRRMLQGYDAVIEVDGGIYVSNAAMILEAGADILVAGSAVFKGDIAENTGAFMQILKA